MALYVAVRDSLPPPVFVFSGGESDLEGNIKRDLQNDKDQLAIPNGSYDITEYEADPKWFKVDPIDESRYDDHHQGYVNADGKTRSGYRLHLGTLSHGCVTVNTALEYSSRQEEWNVVLQIMKNTTKTEVPKREGMQKYIPGTRLRYGSLSVIGEDRIK